MPGLALALVGDPELGPRLSLRALGLAPRVGEADRRDVVSRIGGGAASNCTDFRPVPHGAPKLSTITRRQYCRRRLLGKV